MAGIVTVTLDDVATYIINQDTEIGGAFQIGAEVELKIETVDGIQYVMRIEVEDHEEGEEEASETQEGHEKELEATGYGGSETKQEVRLTTDPEAGPASGKAKFELRTGDGARIRFSIEVEDVSQAGPLTVNINGDLVGTITLDSGEGDLDLDSRDGDDLNNVVEGGLVEVFAADGTLTLSGTLQPK